MKWMAAIGAVAAIFATASASAAPGNAEPVEVMVLGSWHFAGSTRDILSFKMDDVREPRGQAELEALADALAAFRPTKVMVERVAPAPDLLDPGYAGFTPEALMRDRNERVQIGYRIAHKLGHPHVYAIDEQSTGDEPDYFPFGKLVEYDRAKGTGDLPNRMQAMGERMTREFNEKQARLSIPAMLAEWNAPERNAEWIRLYYDMLSIGDAEDQPGAELNALYYMRNAKIFAKLMTVAEPGDRILVVYGDGHSYWLRHFAAATRGFRNVDPAPYLGRAAAANSAGR